MADQNDLVELATADTVGTERVASGLSNPLFVTAPPEDFDRLFILEKNTGQIKILNLSDGTVNAKPFLDLNVSTVSEQGLLGLAFDPDYRDTGVFYVNFTAGNGTSTIQRYQVSSDPDVADASSGEIISRIAQPAPNHNGGWIAFGPDGYLYYGTGDGGGSHDPNDNGQDLTVPLGKMLRIDVRSGTDDFPADPNRNFAIPDDNPFVGDTVNGQPVREDIWAYGLRNPWRSSFDRETDDLYIGDVGQGSREEINFQPAGSNGGENYGWRIREGDIANPTTVGGPRPEGNVDPVYDYGRGESGFLGRSVTGGYVYRGPVTELQGKYVFGDFVSSQIWSFEVQGGGITGLTNWTSELRPDQGDISGISSFGEDAAGNLYIVDFLDGEVFRLVGPTDTLPPPPAPELTLSIGANSISENGGTATATIARNTGTSQDLVVNLKSIDTTEASVPATVTIPAGQTVVNFTVSGVDDGIVDGTRFVTVSASAGGFKGGSDVVRVTDNESAALTLSINANSISENGGTATATVARNSGNAGNLVVTLNSDDTGEATVPATVTIPSGQNSVNFAVRGVDDPIDDGNQSITISASAAGFTGDTDTVTVTDDDDNKTGIKISFVSESAGYQNSVGIYDKETGAGEMLLTNTDLGTNPDAATFSKVLDPTEYDLDQIAYFIIPNGNRLNNWSNVDLENLSVFEDTDGVYRVRDDDGTILKGTGADALFGDKAISPDDFSHVSEQNTRVGFEDLFGGGDRDFNDLVLDVRGVTLIA